MSKRCECGSKSLMPLEKVHFENQAYKKFKCIDCKKETIFFLDVPEKIMELLLKESVTKQEYFEARKWFFDNIIDLDNRTFGFVNRKVDDMYERIRSD